MSLTTPCVGPFSVILGGELKKNARSSNMDGHFRENGCPGVVVVLQRLEIFDVCVTQLQFGFWSFFILLLLLLLQLILFTRMSSQVFQICQANAIASESVETMFR